MCVGLALCDVQGYTVLSSHHFLFTYSQCTLLSANHCLTMTLTRFGICLCPLKGVLDCFLYHITMFLIVKTWLTF
jgi:hypothetical protein